MTNQFASLAPLFGLKTSTNVEPAPVETPKPKKKPMTATRKAWAPKVEVATKAAEALPVDDKKRVKIGDTFLVTFKIMRKPYDESTPTGIKYKKYGIPIGDKKYVNFFIHGMPDVKKGDEIVAEAQMWRTELPDGRKFVHIDLNPTELGATRYVRILLNKDDKPDLPKGTYVRSLPHPMEAAVAFVPIKN